MISINRVTDLLPATARRSAPGKGVVRPPAFELESYTVPLHKFVDQYPGPSLAAAFALGLFVAWWAKRK